MLAGLARVQVTATRLTAEVNGTSLDGCELELFGVTGRASQPVSSPGEVTFSLDRGLPEHAWLWLRERSTRGQHGQNGTARHRTARLLNDRVSPWKPSCRSNGLATSQAPAIPGYDRPSVNR
jgi:hypothetical protein